jgi:pantoate--beta-alanine ligase
MEIPKLLDEAVRMINQKLKTEYLVIADAESLQPVSEYNIHNKVVVLVAAWCGDVRLIDNLVI